MIHLRNTICRTPETNARYQAHVNTSDTFDTDSVVFADYTHWYITENKFPYDNVFTVHHLLISKRKISNLGEATEAEQAEYQEILATLHTQNTYDGYFVNFRHAQSRPLHVHTHLFRWKMRSADTTEA